MTYWTDRADNLIETGESVITAGYSLTEGMKWTNPKYDHTPPVGQPIQVHFYAKDDWTTKRRFSVRSKIKSPGGKSRSWKVSGGATSFTLLEPIQVFLDPGKFKQSLDKCHKQVYAYIQGVLAPDDYEPSGRLHKVKFKPVHLGGEYWFTTDGTTDGQMWTAEAIVFGRGLFAVHPRGREGMDSRARRKAATIDRIITDYVNSGSRCPEDDNPTRWGDRMKQGARQ